MANSDREEKQKRIEIHVKCYIAFGIVAVVVEM